MIAKDQMMYEGGSNQYEKQKKVVQGFKYKLIMICIANNDLYWLYHIGS